MNEQPFGRIVRTWFALGMETDASRLRRQLARLRRRVARLEPEYRRAFPEAELAYIECINTLRAAARHLRGYDQ